MGNVGAVQRPEDLDLSQQHRIAALAQMQRWATKDEVATRMGVTDEDVLGAAGEYFDATVLVRPDTTLAEPVGEPIPVGQTRILVFTRESRGVGRRQSGPVHAAILFTMCRAAR